jgi:predicted DNA-binding protein (MmcQ/YjbR family)
MYGFPIERSLWKSKLGFIFKNKGYFRAIQSLPQIFAIIMDVQKQHNMYIKNSETFIHASCCKGFASTKPLGEPPQPSIQESWS